jgi:hypothetical protein
MLIDYGKTEEQARQNRGDLYRLGARCEPLVRGVLKTVTGGDWRLFNIGNWLFYTVRHSGGFSTSYVPLADSLKELLSYNGNDLDNWDDRLSRKDVVRLVRHTTAYLHAEYRTVYLRMNVIQRQSDKDNGDPSSAPPSNVFHLQPPDK